MKKRLCALVMVTFFSLGVDVSAASYGLTLNTSEQEVLKDSDIDIYVNLNNIKDIEDGLNVCEGNLEYDESKLVINSITGENEWYATSGDKIIFDNSTSVKSDTNIGKINITLKDNTSLKITNINCTDGEEEYKTDDYIINLSIKEVNSVVEVTTENTKTDEATVKNPKTGFENLGIFLVLTLVIGSVIYIVVKRKSKFPLE